VKKRLLFDGITLHSRGVPPRDVELASTIETNFANPGLAFGDGATVPAGKTADAIVTEIFDQG
jgi:hypothetical protein